MRKLAILGSTGSIGTQALDVAARHADRFQVTALVAHSSSEKLFEQVRAFRPQIAALTVEPESIPEDVKNACQWMFGENVLLQHHISLASLESFYQRHASQSSRRSLWGAFHSGGTNLR